MKNIIYLLTLVGGLFLCSFTPAKEVKSKQPVYRDIPYLQEYSIKYYAKSDTIRLKRVGCDRNGDIKILTSRITQQLKRGQSQRAPRANILTWGPLQMDLSQHSFMIGTIHVALTNTEYQFLQLLMENPQRVFSRTQILEAIGVMKGIGTDHIVDSHASRIRSKIRANGGPEVIAVIRSVGFRLADPLPHEV